VSLGNILDDSFFLSCHNNLNTMKLLGIVVIAVIAIVLAHWTLERWLSAKGSAAKTTDLLEYVRNQLGQLGQPGSLSGSANCGSCVPPQKRRTPKGSNYYSEAHESDLHSVGTDLSQYFEVQQSVPDTKDLLKEIVESSGTCSGGVDAYGQCLPATDSLQDAQSGAPMRFNFGSDGTATMMPDKWSYQNENVMNGGVVDGVRGFDGELSDFTIYPAADATKPEGSWTSSYPYIQTFGQW
jgi:hypothetical protein